MLAARLPLSISVLASGVTGISRREALGAMPVIQVEFDEDDVPAGVQRVAIDAKSSSDVMPRTLRVLANATHCLNLLHVPKTAGTYVESKGTGVFYDHDPWGMFDQTLRCVGQTDPSPGDLCPHGRCCPMKDGSKCSVWHVPPHYDDTLQRNYDQCETFCVVRNPASRFRSQHAWSAQFKTHLNCSTESLKESVNQTLDRLQEEPFMADCHFLPQVDYWDQGRGCQHIVKQESLEKDFSDLVARFGMKARFDEKKKKIATNCHAPFDRDSLRKLQHYYAADYEAFGYQMD